MLAVFAAQRTQAVFAIGIPQCGALGYVDDPNVDLVVICTVLAQLEADRLSQAISFGAIICDSNVPFDRVAFIKEQIGNDWLGRNGGACLFDRCRIKAG